MTSLEVMTRACEVEPKLYMAGLGYAFRHPGLLT